ncbi:MAG TPA: tripartite tricarboxylate transporter substrate binding protein [Burkholderiaceae bacterium]|jgi:tripartite-type tricarboxylate transporter receptor subunit TctC|nr:tripartite tricarboxylate transporter substrate binding protein [Burkholderiaceae bacterium]
MSNDTEQHNPGRRQLLGLAAAGLATTVTDRVARAQAAGFPSKPIRIVVPFNAGSGSDSAARVYGEVMARSLGQTVVVENRPGGSGLLAIQLVKQAPADGYTMFVGSTSPMCVMPVLTKNLPYDAFKDLRPVHGMSVGGATIIVKGDSPYKTLPELLAAAKRENKVLNVGTYSDGYMLVGQWVGAVGGVKINNIPYKGGIQSQTDLAAGQLDLAINDSSGVAQLKREGRIRVLAITSDKREPKYPEVPTMLELGYAGFETYVFASLYVRSETPDDITNKLADSVRAAMLSPEGKAYQALNAGGPMMLHTKEMGDFQRREYERFKKVAEAAGIQPK